MTAQNAVMDWMNLSDDLEIPDMKENLPQHFEAYEDMVLNVAKNLGNVFFSLVGDSPYIAEAYSLPPDFIFNVASPDKTTCFRGEEARKMMRVFLVQNPEFAIIARDHETNEFRLVLLNNQTSNFTIFSKEIQKGIKNKRKTEFSVSIQGKEEKIYEVL